MVSLYPAKSAASTTSSFCDKAIQNSLLREKNKQTKKKKKKKRKKKHNSFNWCFSLYIMIVFETKSNSNIKPGQSIYYTIVCAPTKEHRLAHQEKADQSSLSAFRRFVPLVTRRVLCDDSDQADLSVRMHIQSC